MGATYPKIIELLKEEFEVKKTSKYSFCKETGINPTSVERYLCGISEPNQASLQKLSAYFKKPVWWLRDEIIADNSEREKANERYRQALNNIVKRGTISIEDWSDLCAIQMEFAVVMEDAREFEKILLREGAKKEEITSG